jgi:hypothetical protein
MIWNQAPRQLDQFPTSTTLSSLAFLQKWQPQRTGWSSEISSPRFGGKIHACGELTTVSALSITFIVFA